MYFNRYIPTTKSENAETARAFHTYNAVRNFCGKDEPRFSDFVGYWLSRMPAYYREWYRESPITKAHTDDDLRPVWADIKKAIRNAGQPLRNQHVAYFAIINGGMKCGEARDLVQRYSNINRGTPILRMWYIEVDSKKQAQAAEHALHNIFDHAHCMNRQQNKKDYYKCDEASAQRFITANAKDIYNAIMEAIEGI